MCHAALGPQRDAEMSGLPIGGENEFHWSWRQKVAARSDEWAGDMAYNSGEWGVNA
jgi:hypothetical protein